MERKPPAFGTLFAPEVIVDYSFGGSLVSNTGHGVADSVEERTSFARWKLDSLTDTS